MRHSLFERLQSWSKLLASREDLELRWPLAIKEPKPIELSLPDDVRELTQHTSELSFSYRSRVSGIDAANGFLCFAPGGQDSVYLELDGEQVPEEEIYSFDGDIEGTGSETFLVLTPQKPARIVYGVEEPILFDSATQYLTEGARRGFEQGWQSAFKYEETYSALGKMSLDRATPLPDVIAALVARGATPEMAADLTEWLGQDVVLLLPAK